MGIIRNSLSGLGLLVGLACPAFAIAQSYRPEPLQRTSAETPPFRTKTASSMAAARYVPVDSLPPALNDKVRKVLTQPTLVTHAPADEFTGVPKVYRWLMDHPDRAALAWRRLGIPCQPISDQGNGRFAWSDNQGSEIVWFPIADSSAARVWYAEGRVRPGALLPTIPVQAVVVLRHDYRETETASKIRHEVDVFCHADSRAASLVYRLFGSATDRMAEQAAQQLLMFFGTISQYLAHHPEQTKQLLSPTPTKIVR
jgi:hypothetical protein